MSAPESPPGTVELTAGRAPSTPAAGVVRGTVSGLAGAAATTAVLTQAGSASAEAQAAAMAAGAATVGVLTGLGKWARDKGGVWSVLFGWLT